MPSWALFLTAGLCAFVMGYAVNQGGTCAVAAMRELVHERRLTKLLGFGVCTAAAGLVCLPAVWLVGHGGHLFGEVALGLPLIAGSLLLGTGASLNGACLLGSLWRLGNGELRLLALPVGLATGFDVAIDLAPTWLPHTRVSSFAMPSQTAALLILGFAVVLVGSWCVLVRYDRPALSGRWPLATAMLVLGLAGGLLFVVQPGWTFADAVRRGIAPPMMMMAGWGGLTAALLTVLGAATSAIRARSFAWHVPSAAAVLRTISAGALMAFGATLIPGGNDALLLAAIPAGSLSGVTAFTIMSLTVFLLTWASSRGRTSPQ